MKIYLISCLAFFSIVTYPSFNYKIFKREAYGPFKQKDKIIINNSGPDCKYCNPEDICLASISLQHIFGCNCFNKLCCYNHYNLEVCPECKKKKNALRAEYFYSNSRDLALYLQDHREIPLDLRFANPNFSEEGINWPLCTAAKSCPSYIPFLLSMGACVNIIDIESNIIGLSPLLIFLMNFNSHNEEISLFRTSETIIKSGFSFNGYLAMEEVGDLIKHYCPSYFIGKFIPELVPLASLHGMPFFMEKFKVNGFVDGLLEHNLSTGNPEYLLKLLQFKREKKIRSFNLNNTIENFNLVAFIVENFKRPISKETISLALEKNQYMSLGLVLYYYKKKILLDRKLEKDLNSINLLDNPENFYCKSIYDSFATGFAGYPPILPSKNNKTLDDIINLISQKKEEGFDNFLFSDKSCYEVEKILEADRNPANLVNKKSIINGNINSLQHAVIDNRISLVKLLLSNGASITDTNSIGESALSINKRLCNYYKNILLYDSIINFRLKNQIKDLYRSQLEVKKIFNTILSK